MCFPTTVAGEYYLGRKVVLFSSEFLSVLANAEHADLDQADCLNTCWSSGSPFLLVKTIAKLKIKENNTVRYCTVIFLI